MANKHFSERITVPCLTARARCRPAGIVSSHSEAELRAGYPESHAAVTVCNDAGHQHVAKVWVYAKTGRHGKFYPFPPKAQKDAGRQRQGRKRGAQ
jgi:hypothetical protein